MSGEILSVLIRAKRLFCVPVYKMSSTIPKKNFADREKKSILILIIKDKNRGTQREYNSKPLKHSIVKCILVFKR